MSPAEDGPDRVADPLVAWNVTEAAFPREGSLHDKLRFMLGYAVLAPSTHNSQPWHFRLLERGADILVDPDRRLAVTDPDGRAQYISAGAALFNLRVAMRRFGYGDRVEVLPDADDPALAARVTLGDTPREAGDKHDLFASILTRRTNRSRFDERPVPGALISAATADAHAHGAWLHVVEDMAEREVIAKLVSDADRVQLRDENFREELSTWLHPNRYRGGDGMPGYAFGIGDVLSFAAPLVLRTFDWGQGRAAQDHEIALGSPVLAVLGTPDDSRESWVRAGQALQSVLLRAEASGVAVSYLNQVVEVPEFRARLQQAVGVDGAPQIVMRMGHAKPPRPTPRRTLESFLV